MAQYSQSRRKPDGGSLPLLGALEGLVGTDSVAMGDLTGRRGKWSARKVKDLSKGPVAIRPIFLIRRKVDALMKDWPAWFGSVVSEWL